MSNNFVFSLGTNDTTGQMIMNLDHFANQSMIHEMVNYMNNVDQISQYDQLDSKKQLSDGIKKRAQSYDTLRSINESIFMINGSDIIQIQSKPESNFTYMRVPFEKRIERLSNYNYPMTRNQFITFINIVESMSMRYQVITEKLIDELFDHEVTYQAMVPENHQLFNELKEWFRNNQTVSFYVPREMLKNMCKYDIYNGDLITYYLIEKRNQIITETKNHENNLIRLYGKLKSDIKLLDMIQIHGYTGLIPEFEFDILYQDGSGGYVKQMYNVIKGIEGAEQWVMTDGSIMSNNPMLERITNNPGTRELSLTGGSFSFILAVLKKIYTVGWDQFVKETLIARGFQ